MNIAKLPVYRYILDSHNRIQYVNSEWLDFALENGVINLIKKNVIGRSLWDFVYGETTQTLYHKIFYIVRSRSQRVVLPFRCDSPIMQRHMQLIISPLLDGALQLDGMLIKTKEQDYCAMLDFSANRLDNYIEICSLCLKVSLDQYEWLELTQYIRQEKVFEYLHPPQLKYSICPQSLVSG